MTMEWHNNFTSICIVLSIVWGQLERIYRTYKVSHRTTSHVFHYYPQFSLVKIRAIIISYIRAPALWQNRYLLQQKIKPFRKRIFHINSMLNWPYDNLISNIEHEVKLQPFGYLQCHPHCMESIEKKLIGWNKFLAEENKPKERICNDKIWQVIKYFPTKM